MCDVLLAISTEKNKVYTVLSSFGENACEVRVLEVGETELEVTLTEYQKC